MTIVTHLVPASVFGISPPLNPVTGAFVLQDVSRGLYAQKTASPVAPTLVGYVPATSDGFGGITQLARDVDARFYSQKVSGFGASLSGITLTISYPNTSVLWDGVMQTLLAGSINGTVSTGTWSLVVGYNWGLTQVSIVQSSALSPTANYVELCQVVVNTGTGSAAVQLGRVNSKFMQTQAINGPTGTNYSIPTSNASGVMTW